MHLFACIYQDLQKEDPESQNLRDGDIRGQFVERLKDDLGI
jgi:hypothetical protein